MKFPSAVTSYAADIGAPLQRTTFRRIWLASLLSNAGLLIQGVGAAWAMTEMSTDAEMVALVSTASTLPAMIISIPAGAIADMYDRRIISLVATILTFCGSVALALLSLAGLLTPYWLLSLCFVIASGTALFGPAWQASVSEQVPTDELPAAIALNSVNYNIARSFGPALGGLIVAAAGAVASFITNALVYIPLIITLFFWKREQEPSRLPPEGLMRAMVSGARYVMHSPPIRVVLLRSLVVGLAGASAQALLPLIARDFLGGDALTYGILLGAFGLGAVIAGFNATAIQGRFPKESSARVLSLCMALSIAVMSLSSSLLLTALALIVMGGCWITSLVLFNVSVQFSAPRWVSGRALAAYRMSSNAGLAVGGWLCGVLADATSLQTSLILSAAFMLMTTLLGMRQPLPEVSAPNQTPVNVLADPEVKLSITGRSGPVVVEIEYRVAADRARDFHNVMQEIQLSRKRNGAYGWSIARDLSDPELWTERYHCPTWLDYLRQRSRPTHAERELSARAAAFHIGSGPPKVRRMLERPFGSVRWREDTPDRTVEGVHASHGH